MKHIYEAGKTKDMDKLSPKQRFIYNFYYISKVEMEEMTLS